MPARDRLVPAQIPRGFMEALRTRKDCLTDFLGVDRDNDDNTAQENERSCDNVHNFESPHFELVFVNVDRTRHEEEPRCRSQKDA